jgi:hypothetical protein
VIASNAQAAKDSLSIFNNKEIELGRLRLFYPELQALELESQLQQQNSQAQENEKEGGMINTNVAAV